MERSHESGGRKPDSQAPAEADGGGLAAPAEAVGDALRAAVERTLAATADSATGTRQRAQSLLDDVVRRGQVAREQVARRGEEATSRLADAITELRTVDGEELRELGERLTAVERRLAALEVEDLAPDPQVETQGEPAEPLGRGRSA